MNNKIGAIKSDSGKPRFDLISPSLLFEIGQVLEFGSKKYSDRNWEKGFTYGRPFASAMRHLWAWWNGEENDSESGLSHLAHAVACIMMLIEYKHSGRGHDDRPFVFLNSLNQKEDDYVSCTCPDGNPWKRSDQNCPSHGRGSGWVCGDNYYDN